MNYFITGTSNGLGRALAEQGLAQGNQVFGLSRSGFDGSHPSYQEVQCDLTELETLPGYLDTLLKGVDKLDLVILNAGILGPITNMTDCRVADLEATMTTNLWANKVILDWLYQQSIEVDQMVLISSGAAVNGSKGWAGYALSKAALNMLTQLYAHEFESSHLCALAPGIVDTAMQAFISDPKCIDIAQFPSFSRLREARSMGKMPTPEEAARDILSKLALFKTFPSGAFIDIRNL